MKDLASCLKKMASDWFSRYIMYFAYIAAGLALAVPYALLADGNLNNVVAMMFIMPIAAIIPWALWDARKVKYGEMFSWIGLVSIGYMAWVAIPIAFHALSTILKYAGHADAGEYFYRVRYYMLVLVPFGIVFVAYFSSIGYMIARQMWKSLRQRFSGGGTTPPTGFAGRMRQWHRSRRTRRGVGDLKLEIAST